MTNVYLNWQLDNTFGWGILGLNLFGHWANDADVRPLMGHLITYDNVQMCDPLRLQRLLPAADHSNRYHAGLKPDADGITRVDAVVINGLGNDFQRIKVAGHVNVGRCVFENTDLSRVHDVLLPYDELLTGSNWNAEIIEAAIGSRPKVILEGVDTTIFCPASKSGLMDPNRFYIFAGGKIETRKGQDLVIAAFRAFSARHDDCVLVTAWHSPWPHISAGFRGSLAEPVRVGPDSKLDIKRWVRENGLDPDRVLDIGFIPNPLMPMVLREMDVCLQTSRAEPCTSLPVKEAMACGIPVIAALNTGMLDLLTEDNCIPLRQQSAVTGQGSKAVVGWGESDIDEIITALERVYSHRDDARALGLRSRQWLLDHGRTWKTHADALKHWILQVS